MSEHAERRKHPRNSIEIQCKIRCPRTGRYLPAVTSDRSSGGLLLTVQTPVPLSEGQEVEVALPTDGDAVIRTSDLIPACIVRSSALLERYQVLAVQFGRSTASSKHQAQTAAA